MRWKIEVFHKILKSGCRAEQARLRTVGRLVRLLAVFCILSWRVFWLTMLCSYNGAEFTAIAVREWLGRMGVKTLYIEPGSPWENGYNESFNSKLRGECLNSEIFFTPKPAPPASATSTVTLMPV